jgi:hypothetical protein
MMASRTLLSLPGQRAHHGWRATYHGPDQVLGRSEAQHLRVGTELHLSEPGPYDEVSDHSCISKTERWERRLFGPDAPGEGLLKHEIAGSVFDRAPAGQCQTPAALEHSAISERAAALSGKNWSPCWQTTASKVPSGSGILTALPSSHSIL